MEHPPRASQRDLEYLEIFHNRQRRHSSLGCSPRSSTNSAMPTTWPAIKQVDRAKPGAHERLHQTQCGSNRLAPFRLRSLFSTWQDRATSLHGSSNGPPVRAIDNPPLKSGLRTNSTIRDSPGIHGLPGRTTRSGTFQVSVTITASRDMYMVTRVLGPDPKQRTPAMPKAHS